MSAAQDPERRAWVVFSGKADLPWLRLLKPGFRHCFVLLKDGERWVTIDPLSHCMDVAVHHHIPAGFDLPFWMEGRGHTVVPARVERGLKRPAPWSAFTCVEAVKRVLGLHRRLILTPWQLYRYLRDASPRLSNQGESAWEA